MTIKMGHLNSEYSGKTRYLIIIKITSPTGQSYNLLKIPLLLIFSARWVMTFDDKERWENPLMGWSSTADPLSNTEVSLGILYCGYY